ncbi:MAG: putative bifunctional diguanylate cyclase/phosphodiesterase, partial [Alphaproteobacteria bacterium]
ALAASLQQEAAERERAEQQTIHSARHDFLTGLPNRMMFLERLRQEIHRVRRGEAKFAVLYLDLDRFKDVNDTLGHQMGDELLKVVAERLQHAVRETDTVARLGGDEFAVIQTGLHDPSDAAMLAAKLLDLLRSAFHVGPHETRTDASIGIAVYGEEAADEHETLAHADLAMYKAKTEGGGRFCFHLPAMDEEVHARAALIDDLRAGLRRGELDLHCQPQINLDSGVIVGVECLVRWRHPTRGLIQPSGFIPEAERSGLILAIDGWVLEEACRRGRAWLDEGIAPRIISVNVSVSLLKRGVQYLEILEATLAETGFPPQRLELEMTETVFMESTPAHRDILRRLREIGVRLAIDDFGTGYSSLEYLRAFPVDRIKIAQIFVVGVPADQSNAAIVEAIINLATALGIPLIAEGIETNAQLEFLKARGCTEGQGYLFSRPVPLADAGVMMRERSFEPALR